MEDLEKPIVSRYEIYVLGNYLISYDPNIKIEKYSCESYYGIMFYMEDGRYDLCNNFLLGPRIIINKKDGSWNDIPFKPATFGFLPEGVSANEVPNDGNQ